MEVVEKLSVKGCMVVGGVGAGPDVIGIPPKTPRALLRRWVCQARFGRSEVGSPQKGRKRPLGQARVLCRRVVMN